MGYFDGIERIYIDAPNLERTDIWWRGETRPCSFWAPKITSMFSHPMVNPDNLVLGCNDAKALGFVLERLKPIGFINDFDVQTVTMWRQDVLDAGGYSRFWAYGDPRLIGITMGGLIGEMFDLSALMADYTAYLTGAAPPVLEEIQAELDVLSRANLNDYLNFRDVEVRYEKASKYHSSTNTYIRRPSTLVRCGLLLGYPVVTTASLILADLGLPGGYHTY